MPPFRIEPQEFDSGRLAPAVGTLVLERPIAPSPDDEARIVAQARTEGYDLICLALPGPTRLRWFDYVGTLDEYAVDLARALEALRGVPRRVEARPVGPDDWDGVKDLLSYSSATRFSNDLRLPREVVTEHKLDMLRTYATRYPRYSLVAPSPGGLLGLQWSYHSMSDLVLYEIVVKRSVAAGFVGLALLAENVARISQDVASLDRVVSWIYEHNKRSITFFSGLGLRWTGRRQCFYHLWPRSVDEAVC